MEALISLDAIISLAVCAGETSGVSDLILLHYFNRPGVAGAVLQTASSLIDWLIDSVMICENIFTALQRPNDSKSQRTSKLHYWFKSYGKFAKKK